MLSELAQYVIQDYSSSRSWSLDTFEGDLRLPKDLFLVDKTLCNESYLPEKWINSRLKSSIKPKTEDVEKIVKKRKQFSNVENTTVRTNPSRKARNVVSEGNSDVENQV